MPENDLPVLAFPCEFPIKVMGKTQAGFAQEARPYLSGPQATGGVREYGVKIAETWTQEVERALSRAETAAGKKSASAV